MINLLPAENQRQLRAARVNVILLRYVILALAAVGLLAAATLASYLILTFTKVSAEDTIAAETKKASQYQAVERDAKEFQANLQTAKTILSKEVRYSKITVAIAQTIPSGVVLDNLNLDAQTFGTPTTLTARARSYKDALRLKSSFEKSEIFSDVNLASISKADDGSGKQAYPINVSINVTINKELAQS